MLRWAPFLLMASLLGCAADRYTDKPMKRFDSQTEYAIDDHDDGFTLYVWHERFQFFRSSVSIERTGRERLVRIAEEIAADKGKPIKPLNDLYVQSNIGRTFWSTTSWSAKTRAYYKLD